MSSVYKQALVWCDYPLQHCTKSVSVVFTDLEIDPKTGQSWAHIMVTPSISNDSGVIYQGKDDIVPLRTLYLDQACTKKFIPVPA